MRTWLLGLTLAAYLELFYFGEPFSKLVIAKHHSTIAPNAIRHKSTQWLNGRNFRRPIYLLLVPHLPHQQGAAREFQELSFWLFLCLISLI